MKYLNIPANYNFLNTLYKYIIEEFNYNPLVLSNLVVLLPSRRSCNELKNIFLNNSKNTPLLLPNIKAIGDVSYDDILLENIELDILQKFHEVAKPISNIKYKLLLLKKVLDENQNLNIEQGINLAKELNIFLNEVENEKLSLNDLKDIIDGEYAQHWEKTLKFLEVFGKKWKDFSVYNQIISNMEYMYKMLDLHSEIYKTQRPKNNILIAGNLCNIKSTFNLIKTLSIYDNSYFIFKGVENILEKNEYEYINHFHSHYYYNRLTTELKINIDEIRNICYEELKIIQDEERNVIYYSMEPAELTYKWSEDNLNSSNERNKKCNTECNNIKLIECSDEYEELNIIALAVLDYIHNNAKKDENNTLILPHIAIITNVETAKELEIYLQNFNIPYSNTFGNKLIANEIIQFLILILDVYINNFDVNYFLGLLKHKFFRLKYSKEELNEIIYIFEENILRNHNNSEGLRSYKKLIYKLENVENKAKLTDFINNIERIFVNIENLSLKQFIEKHIEIAKNISEISTEENCTNADFISNINEDSTIQPIMYSCLFEKAILDNEVNNKVQTILNEFYENCIDFSLKNIRDYSSIFKYIISELSYTIDYSRENTVQLISSMESRLINYDLVVITNVNDGVLPLNISTDPWMSKKMRQNFGLPPKETSIGIANFEFIQLLNNKNVILTRAIKNNNQPTIKSRFLLRLETYLKACGQKLKIDTTILNAFRGIFLNVSPIKIKRPNPIVDLSLRPKELSATNISNLLIKNPYDIYCKYILQLRPKNQINILNNAAIFGTIVHEVIEEYSKSYDLLKNNTEKYDFLIHIGELCFEKYFDNNKISKMLYFERFVEMIKSFVEVDGEIRKNYSLQVEKWASYNIEDFKVYAKIDRIEIGENINIVDFKTSTPPSIGKLIENQELQLPIELFILKNISFANVKDINRYALKYWHLKDNIIYSSKQEDIALLYENVQNLLVGLVKFFKNKTNGYKATIKNKKNTQYSQISRIDEWFFNE